MREMAGLYAGLAAPGGGPLRAAAGAAARRAVAAGAEAARLVADILTQPLPGRRAAGDGVEDRDELGRAGRLGVRLRRAARGRRSGSGGRTARRCRARPGAGLAVPLLARVFDLLPAGAARRSRRPRSRWQRRRTPAAGLRLLFPPPDAVLSGDGPVTLRAMGGRRPLTFMVDGAPLPTQPAQRQAGWLPPGRGSTR